MIFQLTLREKTALSKRHIFYFEFTKGEHYKHKIIFYIGRREIFVGEFGYL